MQANEERSTTITTPTLETSPGGNSNGQAPSAFTPVDRAVQARLPAAQKLLQMLDMLPAEEPAQDLLPRTLRRVDSEMAKHPSTLRPPQPTPGAPMHHPHA